MAANNNSNKQSASPTPGQIEDDERKTAAQVIQRTYRGHRARNQLSGYSLDASTRWLEVIKDAQYHKTTTPLAPSDSTSGSVKQNWLRAIQIAKRANSDDSSPEPSDYDRSANASRYDDRRFSFEEAKTRAERRAQAKKARKRVARTMGLEYFLEMVDHKHRYGSSLRKYHEYWMTQDTNENFFYWLDQGAGRGVDLPDRPRERLDREQVRYLSREERLEYLVEVNEQGLLIWAKNGELVWTKDELFKDSIDGIVPVSDNTPAFKYNVPPAGQDEHSSLSSDDEDEGAENDEDEDMDNEIEKANDKGEHYVNEDFHRTQGFSKLKYAGSGALFNDVVRKAIKKGRKWIFVADISFRLYIGYKQSGAFQHSSFMHGSRVAAAGQIKVKHGQLRSLEPLSGHYRPPTKNFQLFVQSLKEEGVDMSRVSISKSYAVLLGMEAYVKTKKSFKKAGKRVVDSGGKTLKSDKVQEKAKAAQDESDNAQKESEYIGKQRVAEK